VVGVCAVQSVTGVAYSSHLAESAGFWRWGFLPVLGVDDPPASEPQVTEFALLPAAPNPTTSNARIRYAVPSSSSEGTPVSIRVFDISGRLVRQLVSGTQAPGVHAITWDGFDRSGLRCDVGVYFVHMNAGSFRSVRRLVMLK
jgi:hypothetical protein